MLFGLIAAVAISFLFTLFSILKESLFEPQYVPADDFEREMERIRLEYLEENQRLQLELKEAHRNLDSLKG